MKMPDAVTRGKEKRARRGDRFPSRKQTRWGSKNKQLGEGSSLDQNIHPR